VSAGDGRARRVFDVVSAALAALLLAPVALLVAVVVLTLLGSPVLFRQTRIGRGGEPFSILKFRTMRPERHPGEPDRDRQTRVGRVLRATSLDELPQLVNILRGEMSVIGPRPTLPDQVRAYSARQRRRLDVRPGLTGWAQVSGRNAVSWPDRIELDIWYLEHRSWLLDARILASTVLRLVWPRGITAADVADPGLPGAPDLAVAQAEAVEPR
jgi:lipopolysaccharide/colanic/teichoic acid biosynthesis glycosyltransferase